MKKVIALILTVLIFTGITACSSTNNLKTSKSIKPTAQEVVNTKVKKKMDKTLSSLNFRGIVYLTHNGNSVYQYVNGKNEKGKPLSVNSNMYLGSVSKQFCAASILILRDKGKLSLNDKVNKYFPEYKSGKKITLKNLLTMRSGIPDMVNEGVIENVLSPKNSETKNIKAVKNWIFKQPLKFKPGSEYAYSNSNFFILSNIVEKVSGQHYTKFVRENIFKPLKMNSTGFVDEVKENPKWAEGLKSSGMSVGNSVKGLTKGAGDMASNAYDMEAWMSGLSGGKIISKKSFEEMTEDYSPENAAKYGYGLSGEYKGAVGHSGRIGNYYSKDYINVKYGYNLIIMSNHFSPTYENLPTSLLKDLLK